MAQHRDQDEWDPNNISFNSCSVIKMNPGYHDVESPAPEGRPWRQMNNRVQSSEGWPGNLSEGCVKAMTGSGEYAEMGYLFRGRAGNNLAVQLCCALSRMERKSIQRNE